MQELIRTNDMVLLSFIQNLLTEAGIDFFLSDVHMSIMEGSLGVLPQRILVAEEDLCAAQSILKRENVEISR
ncbi:MAG: DUF2007 domain-containing protein [Pseudomonadota bacterium]